MAKSTETKKPVTKQGSGRRPDAPAEAQGYDLLAEITGTTDSDAQSMLFYQVLNAAWMPKGVDDEVQRNNQNGALKIMRGIKPQSEIEGMLAAQMVSTHNAAMECLRRAMLHDQSFQGRDLNLKHAEKLLSIYSRQIEVLDKHRGKGQQKMTVEYVNVESGGQAIVGNVEPGEPGRRRRAPAKSRAKANVDETGDVVDMPTDANGGEAELTETAKSRKRPRRARKS